MVGFGGENRRGKGGGEGGFIVGFIFTEEFIVYRLADVGLRGS
jgi:hypothetical protein